MKLKDISLYIVLLGILTIVMDNSLLIKTWSWLGIFTNFIDHIIFILFSYEVFSSLKNKAKLKNNIFNYLLYFVFAGLFIYNKYLVNHSSLLVAELSFKELMFRYFFVLLKTLTRIKKLNSYLNTFIKNPAQTLILSFLTLILGGTILLMLPISTVDHSHLGLINSLFTATSAVCVTGLVVVDTATKFSLFGKMVLLFLIQAGGLGIMVLSSFAVFLMRKKISFQDRKTVAMIFNENETNSLKSILKNIVLFTLSFELVGALLLFIFFSRDFGSSAFFFGIFHAVSAFCNAGFALFPNSLETFVGIPSIIMIISLLIIFGSLGFNVIANLKNFLTGLFNNYILKKNNKKVFLNTNSLLVIIITLFLIFFGTLAIYILEHKYTLLSYNLPTQYLAAFFQSVTLRTAGFNSINLASLQTSTYILMMVWMFIGGASGSTAGGVKVNSIGVLWAYFKSVLQDQNESTIFNRTIPRKVVNRVLLLITISLIIVFLAIFLLSITENQQLVNICFEVVSAFATVGISTGITAQLSFFGKIIIIILMFIGRLGPLTIMMALTTENKKHNIKYPDANLAIG